MSDALSISYGALESLVGESLGASDWQEISQGTVDAFAVTTGDEQWIHVDPEAAASSAFGTTIAHGYLTLSLLPSFTRSLLKIRGISSTINYGLNRVRFPRPVRVGNSVRDHIRVLEVEVSEGSKRLVLEHNVEVSDEEAPACVAETVTLLIPHSAESSSGLTS